VINDIRIGPTLDKPDRGGWWAIWSDEWGESVDIFSIAPGSEELKFWHLMQEDFMKLATHWARLLPPGENDSVMEAVLAWIG